MNKYYCSQCKNEMYSATDFNMLNDVYCPVCGTIMFYHPDNLHKCEQLKKDCSRLERLVKEQMQECEKK